jgi:hypothetical protein
LKANLAPKHIRNIDDSVILWFKESNRYVAVSKSAWTLISLFLEAKNSESYLNQLQQSLQLGDLKKCKEIFDQISTFLIDVNMVSKEKNETFKTIVAPETTIERHYVFNNRRVKINFQTTLIESIINPQIEHHLTDEISNIDAEFDIFRTNDYLHLHKDKEYIGSYKTDAFHFLQGRFALELTNTIHNKVIDNWVATFHASTVSNTKESIMIIGDSGNGKSTLSALLMANGLDLLADDFTPLYEDMNLYKYPSAISIKKGAFSLLESQIPNFNSLKTHTNGPKKVNLKYLPQQQNEGNKNSYFSCQTIVYVKFDETKKSKLNHISVEKILETLIPDSWISPNEKHALIFLNWISDVKCYELSYSDNDFAISKFKDLFDH